MPRSTRRARSTSTIWANVARPVRTPRRDPRTVVTLSTIAKLSWAIADVASAAIQGHGRRTTRTRESTRGGGRKARRGTEAPARRTPRRSPRPAPRTPRSTIRRTAARCSTTSAATIRDPEDSSLRSSALVTSYGGLATTRNGRRGSRGSAASVRTSGFPPCSASAATHFSPLPGPVSWTSVSPEETRSFVVRTGATARGCVEGP
jgi:hypothetical protein